KLSLEEVCQSHSSPASLSWSVSLLMNIILSSRPARCVSVVLQRGQEHLCSSFSCTDKVTIENLSKRSSYRLQIRQRSTQARSPLWSGWSPVVLVPAVKTRTRDLNGTREVTLTWKVKPERPAVGGVTYLVNISGSSQNCACKTKTNLTTNKTSFTTYVSYSTVNIFVTARNSMRDSPSAVIHLPAQLAADLKGDHKLHKRSCRQWYKLQDTGPNPESTPKKIFVTDLQDFIPYFYFEHICEDRKPRTVRMCLFYKKQGAPQSEPQDLIIISDSHSPVLTWRPIPPLQQRGFLTHYQLCSVKIKCQNISSSLLMYQLETLEHGAKYNISLAGVTQEGGGPKASVTFNTAPEKQVNGIRFTTQLSWKHICWFAVGGSFPSCVLSVAELRAADRILLWHNDVHRYPEEVGDL
uniref:Fibronectin type-III domain-containing protein n=1 Tax=Echeneis naucrates TaxID=173247 RepID=A0A665VCW4_ECHNA